MNFVKLIGWILFGVVISFIEWRGIGSSDIHIGAVMTAGCLILLSTFYPVLFHNRILANAISQFDKLSLWIYITHPSVVSTYDIFLHEWLKTNFGKAEYYLRPILVPVLTIALFIPIQWLINGIRKVMTANHLR